MTWDADMGPEAERLELEDCEYFSGMGGGGGMLAIDVGSLRIP